MMLEINPTALFIMVKVYNLTTPWIRQWMVKENWNRIFNFDYGIERERGGRRERESWNRISNFDFDIERERERERERKAEIEFLILILVYIYVCVCWIL